VIIVAPATANTLAKLAWGIADNLLLSCLLARRCPLIVAPAMNPAMLAQPATQRCLTQLRRDGVHVVTPTAPAEAGCMVDLSKVAHQAWQALHVARDPEPVATRQRPNGSRPAPNLPGLTR
jgi:phosphopantothenoylcysteine decarboxylase/phosphopantothenate--cysteine ligase